MLVYSSQLVLFTQLSQETLHGCLIVRHIAEPCTSHADGLLDLAGSTKRATGQAIQIAVGNLAGGGSVRQFNSVHDGR